MFLYVFLTPANSGPFVTGSKNSHTQGRDYNLFKNRKHNRQKMEAFERQMNIQQVWLLMYNIKSGNVEVRRTLV